jgi:pimeloyl-ACP methyl ester carboxylesterase
MFAATRKRFLWFGVLLGLALIGAGFTVFGAPARTAGVRFLPARAECASGSERGKTFNYCIYRAQRGTNGGLVYHFHGRNGDAHGWNDANFYTGQVQAYWQAQQRVPPTVVSVSFGPTWLMMPSTANPRSGALDVFVAKVMGEVERRLGAPRYRALLGASMGGFNTLLAALHRPELFSKAVALCPPVYTLTPSASFSALRDFARRSGADPKLLFGLWMLSRDYVRSEQDWQALSLFDLLARRRSELLPELYLSCGLYDVYGNYEGSERFAALAQRKGLHVNWRPLYGGHCAVDIPSVAEALLQGP